MSDKIRAVIVDDEETAIDNLCFELKKYQWISVEGVARNGKAGIRLIEKEHPDLLFLDVELPDMLGMDVAIKVHEMQNWNMHIIFYTAYNKYLIDALRNYAFDFLNYVILQQLHHRQIYVDLVVRMSHVIPVPAVLRCLS